jgi:hypothetical protein
MKTDRERHAKLDPEEAMVEAYTAFERLLVGRDDLVSVIVGMRGVGRAYEGVEVQVLDYGS